MKFLFLILIFAFLGGIAQTPEKNLEKYKHYRERLKYFVSVGDKPGQSNIACIRNYLNYGQHTLRYGQHITYAGEYVGVLATEYKLLSHYKKDTIPTLQELYYFFEAYRNLDMCEDRFPWTLDKPSMDGFAVRTNHSCHFLEDIRNEKNNLNAGLSKTKQSFEKTRKESPGTPAYIDQICSQSCQEFPCVSRYSLEQMKKANTMSQDDICPLLSGLALVVKCLPDTVLEFKDFEGRKIQYHFSDTARKIAYLSVRFMANEDQKYGSKKWRIYRPDSVEVIWQRGGNTYYYGTGYVRSLDYFYEEHDLKKITSIGQETYWHLFQIFPLPNFDNRSMTSHLAVVSDHWRIFGINTSHSGIKKQAMVNGWQPYYLMLWKFLHDKKRKLNRKKIEEHLNSAPFNGPYCYVEGEEHAPDRWASSSRYWHNTQRQKYGNKHFRGNYNGCDYMLLYNLYHLIYMEGLGEFDNK